MRLIDADAFKEYICNALEQTRQCYPDGGRWAETITEQFCLDIDEQPTVTPEPHWIPVTERLPEYGEEVLTITQDDVYEVNHIIDDVHGEWFWEDNGEVIAWMPLPEAFKEVTK